MNKVTKGKSVLANFKALDYLLCVSIFYVLQAKFTSLFTYLQLTRNVPDPSKVTTDPDINPKNKCRTKTNGSLC